MVTYCPKGKKFATVPKEVCGTAIPIQGPERSSLIPGVVNKKPLYNSA